MLFVCLDVPSQKCRNFSWTGSFWDHIRQGCLRCKANNTAFDLQVPKQIGEIEVNRQHTRQVYDKEKKAYIPKTMKENVWLRTASAAAQLVKFYGITPESKQEHLEKPSSHDHKVPLSTVGLSGSF